MTTLHTDNLRIEINQRVICAALTVTLIPGRMTALLGPNGSGKTTFLHTLAGLRAPASGQVLLNEQPLSLLSPRSIAQSVAILFQQTQDGFQQTVADYCLMSRFPHRAYFQKESRDDKQLVRRTLNALELGDFLERKTSALSGGEKRRLAIAAVLAQTPQVYLLDEPLNHLDVRHQVLVLELFKELVRDEKRTVVLSLHDINWVQQYCDDVVMIFPGGEVLHGLVADLLTTENVSRLYGHPMASVQLTDRIVWHPAA